MYTGSALILEIYCGPWGFSFLVSSIFSVMLRRINFYSVCFAFGLSVLLILAGSRYTDNTNYRPVSESRRNIRNFLKIEDGEDGLQQPLPTNAEDGSPDIEKILEKTRVKIENELLNYNFTHSGVHQLDDLLLESGGRPLRSLIISTWRSGTTFLGDILNAQPGNFYHYEPLLKYEIIQIRGPPHADEAVSTIKNMFKCNYQGMDGYFEYGKTHLHQFSHNTRLWDHCKYKKELCFDPNFTGKFCRLFPFQNMKVVRVRLRLIEDLLQDKELKVKTVLLIRDPRGVMQSRQHRNFCQPAADCWRPDLLCADMISDYVTAGRMLNKYPGSLLVLRYEELALEPNATTHKLFEFLRLAVSPTVEEFLRTHTNVEVAGVSSTFRVSRDVPFRWRSVLDYAYVDEIQNACQEAMALWGYKRAHNATHLTSKEFEPMEPYTISQ